MFGEFRCQKWARPGAGAMGTASDHRTAARWSLPERVESVDRLNTLLVGHLDVNGGRVEVGVPQQVSALCADPSRPRQGCDPNECRRACGVPGRSTFGVRPYGLV